MANGRPQGVAGRRKSHGRRHRIEDGTAEPLIAPAFEDVGDGDRAGAVTAGRDRLESVAAVDRNRSRAARARARARPYRREPELPEAGVSPTVAGSIGDEPAG